MNKKFIIIAAAILGALILIVGGINIYKGIHDRNEKERAGIEYKIPDEINEAADILGGGN